MDDSRAGRKLPSAAQRSWLRRGLAEPGGKLPLFDELGQQIDGRTVKACLEQGWAEPWFDNPLKRDWLVCKLTPAGRALAGRRPARSLARPAKSRPQATVIPFR